MILMKVELALPREKYDAGTILTISHQLMRVSPDPIEVLSPYYVILHYWVGNVMGPIVRELMGVTS